MDVSIVAAIGSFIVSERVIKAKATVLVGLLCTVCYDLFIHSNDPISLRVYRGPALIAISLVMSAFCLRTWRRNGIACDELIFLPGSVHAEKSENTNNERSLPLNLRMVDHDGGNVAAETSSFNKPISPQVPEDLPPTEAHDEEFGPEAEMVPLRKNSDMEEIGPSSNNVENRSRRWIVWGQSVCRSRSRRQAAGTGSTSKRKGKSDNRSSSPRRTAESKGLTRFFSSQESSEYAPSGPTVASGGVDLCLPVLFNFHLFMMATHSSDKEEEENEASSMAMDDVDEFPKFESKTTSIPPQILPLIFLSILMIRMVIPRKARNRFWGTIHSAIFSPLFGVSFRDELVGEIATSFVRPSQDAIFAVFYYFSAIYGIATGRAELEKAGSNLTHNMILHNIMLPLCGVLPLFCRFLQTLRQAFDDQRRWPHLGNALKYLTASLVVFYGMTHNEERRSTWWILCFAGCNIYQIWWDLVMDWGLVEFKRSESSSSTFSLKCFQIRMREERLYKSNGIYWKVALFNICFRFTWMLSFIPAYHLNLEGNIENTLSMDVKSIVGMALSLSELLRRCCWGLMKLELETIKMTDPKYNSERATSARIQYKWFAPKETSLDSATTATALAMKRAAYRILVKRIFTLELLCWVTVYIALGLWVAGLPNVTV